MVDVEDREMHISGTAESSTRSASPDCRYSMTSASFPDRAVVSAKPVLFLKHKENKK